MRSYPSDREFSLQLKRFLDRGFVRNKHLEITAGLRKSCEHPQPTHEALLNVGIAVTSGSA
jgi:hypothetical protein